MKRTKIIAFRVDPALIRPVNEMVRKFLATKNYKLYGKRKKKKLTQVKEKFDVRKHWVGMPEFVQKDLAAHRKIIVNFTDAAGVLKFAKLIGQNITSKTKSVWFPKVENDKYQDKGIHQIKSNGNNTMV